MNQWFSAEIWKRLIGNYWKSMLISTNINIYNLYNTNIYDTILMLIYTYIFNICKHTHMYFKYILGFLFLQTWGHGNIWALSTWLFSSCFGGFFVGEGLPVCVRTSAVIRYCAQWSLWISCVVSSKPLKIRPFEDRTGCIAWPSQAMGMTVTGQHWFLTQDWKVGAYVGEHRHFSYKQRLVHYAHFSGFVVSWGLVLQGPASPSRGGVLATGTPEVADCWDSSCTKARKLAWCWLGHVGLSVWSLDVFCVLTEAHQGS